MSCQLSIDCLNELFELLREEEVTLRSCLLVNRLWCEVSVRILWTRIQNYNTLIACLPNESKEILYKNQIIISTPTSKPPLFNYASFIKSLFINEIDRTIRTILENHRPITTSQNTDDKRMVVTREMFMNQTSLKKLEIWYNIPIIPDIP